jgi:hypothetical protein
MMTDAASINRDGSTRDDTSRGAGEYANGSFDDFSGSADGGPPTKY